ncbi:MAG: DUF559 domain-containing protein [Myxococcaceae bacterium]|nr:DUF559 domain-containing protein [Myxococcaceae bacterium]
MRAAEKAVLMLASCQDGVVSLEQACARGMSRDQVKRRVQSGRWCRVHPGVYGIEGARHSWMRLVRAAALWAGDGGFLSHHTAAALWGLPRFANEPMPITVSAVVHAPAPAGIRFVRRTTLLPRETARVQGLRVTSIERTLLDLAPELTEDDLAANLDDALRLKLTTTERLQSLLDRRPGCPGTRILGRLVARRSDQGITESELERKVLTFLEDYGFPSPLRQQRVRVRGRRFRLDFAFQEAPVVIEADGYAWHSTIEAFEADRRRLNALTTRGYRVLQWTWSALDSRPEQLAEELHAVLRSTSSSSGARASPGVT